MVITPRHIDFQVDYCENRTDFAIKLLEYTFLERIRCGKNTLIIHTGKSSEGKSTTALYLIDRFLAMRGLNVLDYLNDVIVYTPFEYPEKKNALLYDKRLKEINFMLIDDARFVVNAKNWQDFLNRAVVDVLSVSRAEKPLCIFFNSQFLSDIDKDLRRVFDFWGVCRRPLHRKVRVRYFRFYEKIFAPEKVEIEMRMLRGYEALPNGKKKFIVPKEFVVNRVRKEVWSVYEESSLKAKNKLIAGKLEALLEKMKKEVGINDRLERLIQYYSNPQNHEELLFHLQRRGKKFGFKAGSLEILGLSKDEGKIFLEKVSASANEYYAKMNVDENDNRYKNDAINEDVDDQGGDSDGGSTANQEND